MKNALQYFTYRDGPVACKQKYFNEKLIARDVTTGCVVAGENMETIGRARKKTYMPL